MLPWLSVGSGAGCGTAAGGASRVRGSAGLGCARASAGLRLPDPQHVSVALGGASKGSEVEVLLWGEWAETPWPKLGQCGDNPWLLVQGAKGRCWQHLSAVSH